MVNKTGLTDELPRDAKAKQALVGREVVGIAVASPSTISLLRT